MRGNIRSWKLDARKALRGKYSTAIFAMVIVNSLSMLGSELGYRLFSGTSIFELIASNAVSFVVTLIVCVFSAGLSYMYLNMAREQTYSYGNLIYFFKNHPDRIIVASFVLALISLAVSLPGFFIGDPGITPEAVLAWSYKYLGVTLFAVVANLILTLPLQQVYYLMADDLELEGLAALKKSASIMKGHILKFLLLQISFLPWFFLAMLLIVVALFMPALTLLSLVGCGIVFWVIPYMEMASVFFYRDLIGDYGTYQDEKLEFYNGYMGNMFNTMETSGMSEEAGMSETAEIAEEINKAGNSGGDEAAAENCGSGSECLKQDADKENISKNDDYNAEA